MTESMTTVAKGPAQIWGRNDGVRAGAVTGPWRSASRDTEKLDASRAERVAVFRREFRLDELQAYIERRPRSAAPVPSTQAKSAHGRATPLPADSVPSAALPAAHAMARAAFTAGARTSLRGSKLLAGALGVLVGFGVGDFALAPAWQRLDSQKVALASSEISTAMPLASRTVRVRVGEDAATEAIARALGEAGANWEAANLAFKLSGTRIGFYHLEDQESAEALARLLGAQWNLATPINVRDYGTLTPRPPRGTLDLWVAG